MKWCSAAALAILTVVSPAWAQDVPPEPRPSGHAVARPPQAEAPVTEERWYGWQLIVVDLATFGTGGPVVHAAHGNWGTFAGSVGLRMGLTVAGGFSGLALANCDHDSGEYCGLGAMVIGGGLGWLTAVIIDDAFLAYDTVEVERPSRVRAAKLTLAPTVVADEKRLGLGLQGTF